MDTKCPNCGGSKADCKHCTSLPENEWREVCNCGMTSMGEHITTGMCEAVKIQDVVDASKR